MAGRKKYVGKYFIEFGREYNKPYKKLCKHHSICKGYVEDHTGFLCNKCRRNTNYGKKQR